MTKFSGKTATARRSVRPTTPVQTVRSGTTYEGGEGFTRDPKSELFLLAVTNMVGENTFYESAEHRDARFSLLIQHVARTDPEWLQKFIPWLRDKAHMRTASVVAAAEYAAAGAPNGRQVIAKTLLRADEPGELLGYWLQEHGRPVPKPVKRGLADAAVRLYTPRAALKYDGVRQGMRFADVIEMVRPDPVDAAQRSLFFTLLTERHGRTPDVSLFEGKGEPFTLPREIEANRRLEAVPEAERREFMRSEEGQNLYRTARWDWERLSGWLPGGMDAEAWERAIPRMGYMALLRNLRNFDQAKISAKARQFVIDKLTDPEQVASSRQFPFRFLSAWKAAPSMHWGSALETALDLSVQNIPELPGRTLVLVDVSGSMTAAISQKSTVARSAVGAVFGVALYKRTGAADLVAFGTDSMIVPLDKSTSILRAAENVPSLGNRVGHGTEMMQAIRKHYNGHDRVVIFTDMQCFGYGLNEQRVIDSIPVIYGFNLGGYRVTAFESGKPGRHEFGGFSDATFRLMAIVEKFESAGWDALFGE